MEYTAIPTSYNGIRYRSQAEARWAIFLDRIHCDYQYEPQGFKLGDHMNYCPDFYLPSIKAFLEVKGEINDQNMLKGKALADSLRVPVIFGDWRLGFKVYDPTGKYKDVPEDIWGGRYNYRWFEMKRICLDNKFFFANTFKSTDQVKAAKDNGLANADISRLLLALIDNKLDDCYQDILEIFWLQQFKAALSNKYTMIDESTRVISIKSLMTTNTILKRYIELFGIDTLSDIIENACHFDLVEYFYDPVGEEITTIRLANKDHLRIGNIIQINKTETGDRLIEYSVAEQETRKVLAQMVTNPEAFKLRVKAGLSNPSKVISCFEQIKEK